MADRRSKEVPMKGLVGLTVACILVLSTAIAADTRGAGKLEIAHGRVKSVSAGQLTITSGNRETWFDVDNDSTVIAAGVGTKSDRAKAAGKRLSVADLVKENDRVVVRYQHTAAGWLRVASVHVK
jgi:hypothetical protein